MSCSSASLCNLRFSNLCSLRYPAKRKTLFAVKYSQNKRTKHGFHATPADSVPHVLWLPSAALTECWTLSFFLWHDRGVVHGQLVAAAALQREMLSFTLHSFTLEVTFSNTFFLSFFPRSDSYIICYITGVKLWYIYFKPLWSICCLLLSHELKEDDSKLIIDYDLRCKVGRAIWCTASSAHCSLQACFPPAAVDVFTLFPTWTPCFELISLPLAPPSPS